MADLSWTLRSTLLAGICLLAAGCGGSTPPVPTSIPSQASAAGEGAGAPGETSRRDPAHSDPVVVIKTTLGEILVQLDPLKAPITVDNFLVHYVDNGHYAGTIFHHVEQGFMVLGGGYTADLQLKPARTPIASEAHNGLTHRRGTIAMARQADVVHSADCQFFFNLADNPSLDHKGRETAGDYGYCVFGQVVQGMEVLDAIAGVPVRDAEGFPRLPVTPVIIQSVERVR
jgi:cyclophilin family peptidyl-prolyl cis-trans isomerase